MTRLSTYLSLLALLLVAVAVPAQAQVCNGNVTLSTQAQVDAFDCATVTGNLIVEEVDSAHPTIVSIDALSNLTSVGGDLRINYTLIPTFEALSSLRSVGGNLELDTNAGAGDSYEGLRNLQSVGGLLDLDDNLGVTTLNGLRSLTSVGGLYIANSNITSLAGLEGITSVSGQVDISDNHSLTSFEGLNNLQTVGAYFGLYGNGPSDGSGPTTLDAFRSLTSVGSLSINDHDDLETCAIGLAGLISGSPPAFTGVGSPIDRFSIINNAPAGRCNSEADVLAEYVDLFDVPPGFTKSFAPDAITVGEVSRLTFTIDNSVETAPVSPLFFLDNMPAGMVVAPSANVSSTCGGTVTATEGSGSIQLSGGSVGAGSTCAVAVDVTSTTVGVSTNTSERLIYVFPSGSSTLGDQASDVLTLNAPAPPVVTSVSVTPDPATVGEPVTITAAFTDPFAGDTNGCAITYGDGSGATGPVNGLTCTDTYAYPAPGDYTVTVTVTDGFGGSGSRTSSVTVVPANEPPVADAGADRTVEATSPAGADVTLIGSNSADPDGDALIYSWTENGSEIATFEMPTVALGLGDHTLTLSVSDPSGATDRDDVVITVVDTTPPVITLNGNAVVTLEFGSTYAELGATASDLVDGDAPAVVTGTVDPGTLGEYVVRYNATDAASNAAEEVTRTVHIVDTTPPVITLDGNAVLTLECSTAYAEPGATAFDNVDGVVEVQISGIVDADTPGQYVVRYNATDAAGNTAEEVTRTVTVEDTTAPVLTVGTAPLVLWPPNHTYRTVSLTDLGLAVIDACDAGIAATSAIVTEASSDEAENADDDGDTTDDIVIDDCRTVQLRAERQGVADGRVYTLALAVADASGNVGMAAYEVAVPVSRKQTAMGGSAAYSVEGCAAAPAAAAREAFASEVSADSEAADSEAADSEAADSKDEAPDAASRGAEGGVPAEFALQAAYPNPFARQTTVGFALPEAAEVSVVVYDVMGRRVATLAEGSFEAGRHEVRFTASVLPSGTYLVRMTTEGGFTATQRLTLVR